VLNLQLQAPLRRGFFWPARNELNRAWKATLKIKCPHCGKVHEISVRDTYINGALRDAAGAGPRWTI